MKVYIIIYSRLYGSKQQDYTHDVVLSVFSTEELAKAYCKERNDNVKKFPKNDYDEFYSYQEREIRSNL